MSVQVLLKIVIKLRFEKFQYIICVGSSYKFIVAVDGISMFQYIICVGSRNHFHDLGFEIK